MRYLHTMVRIADIDESLDFYCGKLGMVEVRRWESEEGRFTNIFLTAKVDAEEGAGDPGSRAEHTTGQAPTSPLLELTYNWPSTLSPAGAAETEKGKPERYSVGRNFGHLAYEVENIYETCQTLMDAGITINRPPRDGRMAFIKSPDGISIELLQKGNALPSQEPWQSMENDGTW